MEKKDDVWFGFVMIAPTTASSSRWIQLEVTKEKKLSYTACLGQCDWTSSKYEQKKELEVKHDKDKKYTFEGGTVEYSEVDPFAPGGLSGAAIAGIVIGCVVVVILLVFGIYVLLKGPPSFATKARDSIENGWSSVRNRLRPDSRAPLLPEASSGYGPYDSDAQAPLVPDASPGYGPYDSDAQAPLVPDGPYDYPYSR
jgi:hypothetical protein